MFQILFVCYINMYPLHADFNNLDECENYLQITVHYHQISNFGKVLCLDGVSQSFCYVWSTNTPWNGFANLKCFLC